MPLLREIDELTRGDHHYLEADDQCLYIGEYTARKGFNHSATNNLILNLKKCPSRRGTPEWKWKINAVRQAAENLRQVLSRGWLACATLVPIPPSKAKTDPLYDDRIVTMLRAIGGGRFAVDVRELIVQDESMAAYHDSEDRPGPQELGEHYAIDETLAQPEPVQIGIFDDTLTTGSHFKAAQNLLSQRFPGVPITGIFLARRVPEAVDWEGMFL